MRYDEGMPFLLQYENIARFTNGKVYILDRRIYPSVEFVECKTVQEVAEAIASMVTQSAGPYTAIGLGMALAAQEGMRDGKLQKHLEEGIQILSNARPTQSHRYRVIAIAASRAAKDALEGGADPVQVIVDQVYRSLQKRYKTMREVASHLMNLIPDGSTILTQCYAETVLGGMVVAAREQGKALKVICLETRPYLQGARLTASVFQDAGWDTTVITDNMVANVLSQGRVDTFTSAADTFSEEGWIVNKVGTLGIAQLARIYDIPYYVTGVPEQGIHTKDFQMEERNPDAVLSIGGVCHTKEGVKGYYPSFDIVPASLITGIVTEHGVFAPHQLEQYFSMEQSSFYE